VARWRQRVFRLIPRVRFEVDEIFITGTPWRTRIATRVTVRAQLLDGTAYGNVLM